MMRPLLIRTDIADLLSSASFLLPALGELDLRLLPLLAVHVDALRLQLRDGGLGEVDSVGPRRRLVDDLELLRDPRRATERFRIGDSDPEPIRPDERVDLVHHPLLVSTGQRRTVLQHDLDAVAGMVTAIDPALERSSKELLRDGLVLLVLDPVVPYEDLVLEHRRTGALLRVLHLDHVEIRE